MTTHIVVFSVDDDKPSGLFSLNGKRLPTPSAIMPSSHGINELLLQYDNRVLCLIHQNVRIVWCGADAEEAHQALPNEDWWERTPKGWNSLTPPMEALKRALKP